MVAMVTDASDAKECRRRQSRRSWKRTSRRARATKVSILWRYISSYRGCCYRPFPPLFPPRRASCRRGGHSSEWRLLQRFPHRLRPEQPAQDPRQTTRGSVSPDNATTRVVSHHIWDLRPLSTTRVQMPYTKLQSDLKPRREYSSISNVPTKAFVLFLFIQFKRFSYEKRASLLCFVLNWKSSYSHIPQNGTKTSIVTSLL